MSKKNSKHKTSLALYRGWDVTLVLMSVTPLMALANALSAPAIRRAAAARARADSLPSAAAAEALHGARTVYVSALRAVCGAGHGTGVAEGAVSGGNVGAVLGGVR